MNDIVVKDEMKRMCDTLEPLVSSGTILILSKEQVEKLEEHFLKDPFPSHSTLVALDSRLGLEEKQVGHVQDWFSVERQIKHKRGYHLYARGYHPYAGHLCRPSHSSCAHSSWAGPSWSKFCCICPSCQDNHSPSSRRPRRFSIRVQACGNLRGGSQQSSWPMRGEEKELEASLKRLSTAEPEEGDLEDTDKSGPGDF
ncbi:hypothetical protein GHT09_019045 [Marmota monax]|uniref:Homeobox domain-containing protein n=1 Tax=Marmota monax TaxID=9995 RepID=A0A834PIL8_MARMO|nr:hypothetical protein GHT09_019045 [Marmota monax]